jgi:hypothetical protein
MGVGIETVLAYLSDAASTGAQAMTAGLNQSFSVRAAASPSTGVTLESIYTDFQDAGDIRIRSPRMHDDVNGIRLSANSRSIGPSAHEYFQQPLFSQDTLTVEAYFDVAPTATHISAALMTIFYDDLPGVAANMRTWGEVQPNIVDYLSVPCDPTSSATAGQWGAGVAINNVVDVFKANTLYALIGFEVQNVAFSAWAIQGVDTGNLIIGAGGGIGPVDSRRYFPWLSDSTGKAAIPVINSQNKATTNVMVADRTASTAYQMTLLFAQLSA